MSLPTTKATTATATHAVVQALETYIQNQNLLGEIAELDELLYELIDMHKDNELALKRVVHCIYNLLQSNSKYNVKFGSKVFYKLIAVVIADSSCEFKTRRQHSQLVANVLICVQLHGHKFPRIDSKFLLRQLWALSLNSERQPYAAQILVQLFDDFVRELGEECSCSAELHAVIKCLLQSEEREQRKSAYLLMKKMLLIMQTEQEQQANVDSKAGMGLLNTLKCSEQHWFAYVAIMECLEEQQSHLVLPTLNTLLPRLVANNNPDDNWLSWLRILYARLLQDNNILVLRWTVTYFLSHFNLSKLCRANLLTQFLEATNKTQLHNVESNFLPAFKMYKFMSQVAETQLFLEALGTVQWHAVPLLFWLRNMQPEQVARPNKNVLLQLSTRIRTLKDTKLRELANKRVFELFEITINKLPLGDYMVFIETLFNNSDGYYNDHKRLTNKIRNCENFEEAIDYFNKPCYEIIVNDFGFLTNIDNLVIELIQQLSKLPNEQHGWWRLFPFFELLQRLETDAGQLCLQFYSTRYEVNYEVLKKGVELSKVQAYLLKQLNCKTKEEKCFVREQCVDWFVQVNVESWSQLKELQLKSHAPVEQPIKPIDILECGTKATFAYLAHMPEDITQVEENENELPTILALLKKHQSCKSAAIGIVKYAAKFLSNAENEKLAEILINNRYDWMVWTILTYVKAVPRAIVVQGIIEGEASTGNARIQEAYLNSLIGRFDNIAIRNQYIQYVKQQTDDEINLICDELQSVNKKLNVKKPRYFENCKEHRYKIRIARALLMLKDKMKWSDEIWIALLSLNDQLNISYMYECLTAQLLPSLELLLERMQTLGTLKPSQQVSIISVLHIYCMRNWVNLDLEQLQKIVNLLLPHTMGAHFQTRLLAQLILHRVAVKCEESSTQLPFVNALKSSIEMTLGAKLQEFENESRLMLPAISHHDFPADVILYMTNAPFDEYDNKKATFDKLKANLEVSRAAFKARMNQTTNAADMPVETENSNVQRKMNPMNDICHKYQDDFSKTDEQFDKQELIVVASLIDKLPNLGGLARTCEVLGVKTLILSSKSLVIKSDFTNLSMTAEKTLNIVEVKTNALSQFLIEKQYMGYKIVGAEQTAHSVSFDDFQFPDKCVLLLGHEKHGIPVDLIALLDFAVEIPQFGVVRSLNVHVTGSLFIWEYCKQHLKKE